MQKETKEAIAVLAATRGWSVAKIVKAFNSGFDADDIRAELAPKPRPRISAAAVEKLQRESRKIKDKRTI